MANEHGTRARSIVSSYLPPARLTVTWHRYPNGCWCALAELNLADPHFAGREGVYIIWRGSDNHRVVRVGQGVIADRLQAHRGDREILSHGPALLATWADVALHHRDGVERYLAEHYRPLVG